MREKHTESVRGEKVKPAKNRTVFANIRWVVKTTWGFDKMLFFIAGTNSVFTALTPFVPIIMLKMIIDEITTGKRPQILILLVTAGGLGILAVNGITAITRNYQLQRFLTARLRFTSKCGEKRMRTDQENLEKPDVLDLSERAGRALDWMYVGIEGMLRSLADILEQSIALALSSIILLSLSPVVVMTLCLLAAVNFYVNIRTRDFSKSVGDKLTRVERQIDYLYDVMYDFKYGKDIRIFGMAGWLDGKFAEKGQEEHESVVKIFRRNRTAQNIYTVTTLFQEAVLYGWLIYRVIRTALSIGNFTMYASMVRTFTTSMATLLDSLANIHEQNKRVIDYRDFIDYPDRPVWKDLIPLDRNNPQGYRIVFENVSFAYPGRNDFALKNFYLTIEPGERLAIVGLNGAGKSTFIKLLTRLYEPVEGRILLNGTDVRRFDREAYYKLFSVVFQEINMFSFTVAENISMKTASETDMEKVRQAAEMAGIMGRIDSLEKGLDTTVLKVIDEKGVEFSGGQNQKLALARALYKDAPIVVLDEPTAALDALAEYDLYNSFDKLIGKKTAIYISHRLSSTRFCDRVALFADGELQEYGTHAELIEKNGAYARMFAIQAKYYKETEGEAG